MSDILVKSADGEDFTLNPKHFEIPHDNLDIALCNNARSMLEYGTFESDLRLAVARLEAALDEMDAELDVSIRGEAKKNNLKVTEAGIKHQITLDSKRQALLDAINQTRRHHNVLRWAMSALQKRSDCLVAMAYRERALIKADS